MKLLSKSSPQRWVSAVALTSKHLLRLSKGSYASKIEHKNVALAGDLPVETVGNSTSSRFIDNLEHIETGDGSSIFSGLALREVGEGGGGGG
jgi:hypothetical protein